MMDKITDFISKKLDIVTKDNVGPFPELSMLQQRLLEKNRLSIPSDTDDFWTSPLVADVKNDYLLIDVTPLDPTGYHGYKPIPGTANHRPSRYTMEFNGTSASYMVVGVEQGRENFFWWDLQDYCDHPSYQGFRIAVNNYKASSHIVPVMKKMCRLWPQIGKVKNLYKSHQYQKFAHAHYRQKKSEQEAAHMVAPFLKMQLGFYGAELLNEDSVRQQALIQYTRGF